MLEKVRMSRTGKTGADRRMCSCLHFLTGPGECSFVIMDTREKRSLAAAAYNERRAQCAETLSLMARHRQIPNLCQASLEDVQR
jgi:galactokinase